MRIVVAPDSFKGTLPAVEVAAALATGVRRRWPEAEIVEVPLADGGEGTVDALIRAGFSAVPVEVTGPFSRPVTTALGIDHDVVVVETATTCGFGAVGDSPLDALAATSRGTGEALRAALDSRARTVVIAAGGSVVTDGGAGLLQALGVRLLDANGGPVENGGGALETVVTVDWSGLDARLRDVDLVLAADVDSPLLGSDGALSFAAQKGATSADQRRLDRGLRHWASVVTTTLGHDRSADAGAGAAGGVGFALLMLGARWQPGADYVMDLLGVDGQLAGADLAVTGEGRLDEQTLAGKLPVRLVARAAAHRVPTVAVVGRCTLLPTQWRAAGFSDVVALANLDPRCAGAELPGADVTRAALEQAAHDILTGKT